MADMGLRDFNKMKQVQLLKFRHHQSAATPEIRKTKRDATSKILLTSVQTK